MTSQVNANDIIIIRTFECELCLRFDSIMMPREEMIDKISRNEMRIGTHLINHDDHMRIIYFDENCNYLGDIISLNMEKSVKEYSKYVLPIFKEEYKSNISKLHTKIGNYFRIKSHRICILGPSYVGKTSLSMLLETGIPERHNGFTRRSPTLHKSTKRIKLGKTNLLLSDMGGQLDFWDGWVEIIQKSDRLIFMLDGTANNSAKCAKALDHVLNSRINNIPILVLINKYDLIIDGYASSYMSDGEILAKMKNKDLHNLSVLNTSVYNGICYNYKNCDEETSIHQVILDFVNRN